MHGMRTLPPPYIPPRWHLTLVNVLFVCLHNEGLMSRFSVATRRASSALAQLHLRSGAIGEFSNPRSGSYWLITTVVAEGFLPKKAKGMHDREIIEGEETHIIRCRKICMFMPHP
jgi:hypothetical protein